MAYSSSVWIGRPLAGITEQGDWGIYVSLVYEILVKSAAGPLAFHPGMDPESKPFNRKLFLCKEKGSVEKT